MFGNITDDIAHNARRRPDHPAMIDSTRALDYRSLDADIKRTANHLRDLGIGAGDFVGLAMADTIDNVVAMLGIIRLGAVLIPMDCRWLAEEKIRVAGAFGVPTVIVDDEPLAGIETLIVNEDWHRAVAQKEPEGEFPSDPKAPLWLSLSSGTTGVPKGPLVTHYQMSLRFMSQWVSDGFTEHDRNMLATPLYFGGGRGFTIVNLIMGATVFFHPPPYRPEDLVETVNKHRITTLFLVPTLLWRLLKIPAGQGPLMPSLRVLLSSGSILHVEEREQILRQLSPCFFNIYSSTEGGAVSVLPPEATGEAARSVGRAAFQTEFEVVDENDRPLPPDEIGRIRHRSPWLPEGFHNNPEETKKVFKDGWYYPGDLGRIDEHGFLYIVGRVKDLIIRGGVNIYPAEIEEILIRHAAVHDAAAVPWESRELGEDVAVFVVRGDTADGAGETELIAHCRAQLAPYKVPRRIFFVDELPKSSLGKILKTELVKRLPPLDEPPEQAEHSAAETE